MTTDRRLRALIVDDEAFAVERLELLCAGLDGVEVIGSATDGEAALRLIDELVPDLVLLDIAMPEVGGIAVARAVAENRHLPAIIFCTAFDRFAVEAFDLAAVDYLLKPVAPDRLARALDRARAKLGEAGPRSATSDWVQELWVPYRDELIRIAVNDVDRIKADRDYMHLSVGARRFLIHQTISGLERRLDPALFIRLHRSHIVRRDFIKALAHDNMGVWSARLADDTVIRIGRNYISEARSLAK